MCADTRADDVALLWSAIRTLRPIERMIMQLRLKGLSIREIAKRLGCANGTVSHYYYDCALPKLRQGYPKLRKILGNEG